MTDILMIFVGGCGGGIIAREMKLSVWYGGVFGGLGFLILHAIREIYLLGFQP